MTLRSHINSTLLFTVAMIVSSLVPVITLPFFAKILTVSDFGVIALVESYAVLVAGLAFLGSTIAYDRNFFAYQQDPTKTAQLLYSIIFFVSGNFIILLLLTRLWGDALAMVLFQAKQSGDLLCLSLLGTFLIQMVDFLLAYFKNARDPFRYFKYSISNSLLYLVVSCFFVLGLKAGVRGLLMAKFLAASIICLLLARRVFSLNPFSVSWQVLREAWRISLPLTPKIFMGVVATRIDKYFISVWGTLGNVGVYSIGQKIAYFIFAFQNALEQVFQPKAYQAMFDDPTRAKQMLGQYLMPFFYLAAGFTLGVSLFAHEILGIMLPADFSFASDVICLFAIYYLILFFSKMASYQLIYKKKTHVTAILLIASYGVNIFLNYILIKQYGSLGAALASVLTGVLTTVITFVIAQYYYTIRWDAFKVFSIFGFIIGANVLCLWLNHGHQAVSLRLGIKSLVMVMFIGLGAILGILKDVFFFKEGR